jgi:hypothetical protein
MHLHHPSLSYNGKKKGKVKFRNADEAQKSRELDESWKALQKQWGVEIYDKKRKRAMASEPLVYNLNSPADRSTAHIKSLGQDNGVAVLKPVQQYTGDKMIGIAVMHKSCLQPVFSQEAAADSASMRR